MHGNIEHVHVHVYIPVYVFYWNLSISSSKLTECLILCSGYGGFFFFEVNGDKNSSWVQKSIVSLNDIFVKWLLLPGGIITEC